jgi:hypothetical protein
VAFTNGGARASALTAEPGPQGLPSTPSRRDVLKPKPHRSQTLAVTDGRIAVGAVEVLDNIFIATDVYGEIIGTFSTLREATRALPAGRTR